MIENFPPNAGAGDELSIATSRLDASLLRYVLLHRSRMNMLLLDREVRKLLGDDGMVQLPPGVTRSDTRFRAETTMQLAAELALARPDVVRWVDDNALRRQMAVDAAYYQSERWLAGKAPDAQPGAWERDTDSPAWAQAHPTGQADEEDRPPRRFAESPFGRYMRRRTRLGESPEGGSKAPSALLKRRHEAQTAVPLPAASTELLAGATLLAAIAQDVFWVLMGDVRLEDWVELAAQRADNKGFRMPPPEVFDALLLRHRSLVSETPARAVWRYSPSGERLRLPHEGLADPGHLIDMARRIRHREQVLSALLEVGTGQPVFQLLADGFGVLPTTPAWADVQRALLNLEAPATAEAARGDPDDAATIEEFHAHLEGQGLQTLLRVLYAAAFFGFLGPWGNHVRATALNGSATAASSSAASERLVVGGELRRGLALLSEGLRFAQTPYGEIDAKLARLNRRHGELTLSRDDEQGPGAPWLDWPDEGDADAALSAIKTRLLKAIKEGRAFEAQLSRTQESAWEQARQRMARFCRDGQVEDAGLEELVCASLSVGPGGVMRLDPRRMTLPQWGDLCMRVVKEDRVVPRWTAVIALQRLGANALSPAQQDQLLAALGAREANLSFSERLVDDTARRLAAWRPSSQAAGTAIFIRKAHSPLTEHWMRPPSQGLVLITTGQSLSEALANEAFFRALPRPVSIHREAPVDSGVDAALLHVKVRVATGERHVLTGLAQRLGAQVTPSRRDRSHLLDPGSPDDLLLARRDD